MSSQAAAALCTHGVPLVGHGTGTCRSKDTIIAGILLVLKGGTWLDFWVWCSCMRRANVPICSFSKGSSISFRLASRRMSVQIYRRTDKRWERSQIKGCFITTHYRFLLHTTRWQQYCMFLQLLRFTLWTVAPKLANVDRQSMSTLRL